MTRAVLAVMAGLLCALAGLRYASSLRAGASRLRRWQEVLQCLSLLLEEGTLSIPDALICAADDTLPPDRILQRIAHLLRTQPRLSLPDAYRRCSPEQPEAPVLDRMFTRLGQGSKDKRRLAVDQAAQEISRLAEKAAAQAAKDATLWQKLGLIGGICLTLLLF